MTDAREEGFGVVEAEAAAADIREEARLAENRGWVVSVDDWYSEGEAAELASDEAADRGAQPYQR
eukprot:3515755-Lingulodinium_polyedra.AAC.1